MLSARRPSFSYLQFQYVKQVVLYGFVIKEQAWGRWLATKANGVRADKGQAVALLQNIAMSETMEEYRSNLGNLKSSEIWREKSSKSFHNWIEKTLLPIDKVCLK